MFKMFVFSISKNVQQQEVALFAWYSDDHKQVPLLDCFTYTREDRKKKGEGFHINEFHLDHK